MFDFAWSEIALIAGVALVLIGPKDMPVAIRTVTGMIKKARRMASEFQTHVDEMVREANLDEVRSQINEIRNFDVRSHVERAVDPDGALRNTFNERLNLTPTQTVDPLPEVIVPEPPASGGASAAQSAGNGVTTDAQHDSAGLGQHEIPGVPQHNADSAAEQSRAPAFIPPNLVPQKEPARVRSEAPPFIPPSIASRPRS